MKFTLIVSFGNRPLGKIQFTNLKWAQKYQEAFTCKGIFTKIVKDSVEEIENITVNPNFTPVETVNRILSETR